MQKTSVIIIGAGPAGLTAALQLKRFGIPALVFEGAKIGGLLHNANLVENYPGFPQGMRGGKLVNLLKKQVENVGVEFLSERVISLGHDGESFFAKTDKDEYHAKIAIVASGTKPRKFDDALIAEDAQSRVFYEVYDLLDVKNEEIIIVGAGDAAFDYALNLARNDNFVTILNRGENIRALKLLVERMQENKNIRYVEEAQIRNVTLNGERGLMVEVRHRESVEIKEANFLLGALGRIPDADFLSEEICQKEDELAARKILYFIGDVRNGIYRQTAIAAGDALRAAMEIEEFYKEKL
ncbi:MAG: NAD(P)/FAD-dependent oxidoreductase [Anaerolineae bacterium]|jgi:thioredoxin reductase (NADPH)|nr:NAD(P)/FAD-dependent oxidoreductase [Anaerolineae bacterium]MBT7192214.1 NAD(P)/FAD-dependent oxidoreductase [Anaerolineae bacterium]MBT7989639.1 NAD(P)/FAD-dependent oxidoreductase [Anaerolineae bacterium]